MINFASVSDQEDWNARYGVLPRLRMLRTDPWNLKRVMPTKGLIISTSSFLRCNGV